jgi:putative membrane protein
VEEPPLEVDARFLLANERTLLAWVRTGLTLMAAGVAARQFGEGVEKHRVVAGALVLLGTLSVLAGARRYLAAERALRAGQLPATGLGPVALVLAVAVIGVSLLVSTVIHG